MPSNLVRLASSSDSVSKKEKFMGGISRERFSIDDFPSDLTDEPMKLEVGVVSGEESNKDVLELFVISMDDKILVVSDVRLPTSCVGSGSVLLGIGSGLMERK